MSFHRFMTFDPYLTFAEGERGFKEKIFLQSDGTPTETAWYGAKRDGKDYLSSLWRIGRETYATITKTSGEQLKLKDFHEILNSIKELEKNLVPTLQPLIEDGTLRLHEDRDSPSATSLESAVADAPAGWLLGVFMQLVRPSVVSGHLAYTDLPDFEELLSVVALAHVDDYIIAAQLAHDVDEALELIMVNTTSAKLYRETLIAAKDAVSARGRRSATVRHGPGNQKKAVLLAEWDATHDEYDSRADFARIISSREKMKERTLYDWITTHEKTKP